MNNFQTHIEFVGDPSCPFCYLGMSRFQIALEEIERENFEISISPFFINPDLPSNGLEFEQYLFARFGDQSAIAKALLPLQTGCAEDSIPLNIEKIKVMPNVLNAQRSIWLAKELERDELLFLTLQQAHFVQGLDISRDNVLRAKVDQIGLDGAAFTQMINDETARQNVLDEYANHLKQGIKEVPTWIIGRKYVVQGVQTVNFWRNVLTEIEEKGREIARDTLRSLN